MARRGGFEPCAGYLSGKNKLNRPTAGASRESPASCWEGYGQMAAADEGRRTCALRLGQAARVKAFGPRVPKDAGSATARPQPVEAWRVWQSAMAAHSAREPPHQLPGCGAPMAGWSWRTGSTAEKGPGADRGRKSYAHPAPGSLRHDPRPARRVGFEKALGHIPLGDIADHGFQRLETFSPPGSWPPSMDGPDLLGAGGARARFKGPAGMGGGGGSVLDRSGTSIGEGLRARRGRFDECFANGHHADGASAIASKQCGRPAAPTCGRGHRGTLPRPAVGLGAYATACRRRRHRRCCASHKARPPSRTSTSRTTRTASWEALESLPTQRLTALFRGRGPHGRGWWRTSSAGEGRPHFKSGPQYNYVGPRGPHKRPLSVRRPRQAGGTRVPARRGPAAPVENTQADHVAPAGVKRAFENWAAPEAAVGMVETALVPSESGRGRPVRERRRGAVGPRRRQNRGEKNR